MGRVLWKISWMLMRWIRWVRAQVSMSRYWAWGSGVPGGVGGVVSAVWKVARSMSVHRAKSWWGWVVAAWAKVVRMAASGGMGPPSQMPWMMWGMAVVAGSAGVPGGCSQRRWRAVRWLVETGPGSVFRAAGRRSAGSGGGWVMLMRRRRGAMWWGRRVSGRTLVRNGGGSGRRRRPKRSG